MGCGVLQLHWHHQDQRLHCGVDLWRVCLRPTTIATTAATVTVTVTCASEWDVRAALRQWRPRAAVPSERSPHNKRRQWAAAGNTHGTLRGHAGKDVRLPAAAAGVHRRAGEPAVDARPHVRGPPLGRQPRDVPGHWVPWRCCVWARGGCAAASSIRTGRCTPRRLHRSQGGAWERCACRTPALAR